MKKPSLEEVKEYFKNAETIECIGSGLMYNLSRFQNLYLGENCFEDGNYYFSKEKDPKNNSDYVLCWSKSKGYSKILTYKESKEETFVISREQIITLNTDGNKDVRKCMRDWFPSAFVEDKKELVLEVGKWYTYPAEPKFITFIKENGRRYGIGTSGNWFHDSDIVRDTRGYREATPEEVKEALTKEAVKRYKVRDYVEFGIAKHIRKIKSKNYIYDKEMNVLLNETDGVFVDGIWSEIIPTITKQEAEQKLNCKII